MIVIIFFILMFDYFINDRINKTLVNIDFIRLFCFIFIICDVVLFGCYGFLIRLKKCGNRLIVCK